jgi:ribosomal protein S12 methylthiotransferase accessory factor
MQNEHYIPGKDASLEHSISLMQAKLLARGFDIEECSWLNPVDNVWSVHVRNRECTLMATYASSAYNHREQI